jgi:hypothetical protein
MLVCKGELCEQLVIPPGSFLGCWDQLCLKQCPIDDSSKPAPYIYYSFEYYYNFILRRKNIVYMMRSLPLLREMVCHWNA